MIRRTFQKFAQKVVDFFTPKKQESVVPKFHPKQRLSLTDEDFKRWVRKNILLDRNRNQPTRPPLLTGERLARTQEACSPKHLTVLSKGARATWNTTLPSSLTT